MSRAIASTRSWIFFGGIRTSIRVLGGRAGEVLSFEVRETSFKRPHPVRGPETYSGSTTGGDLMANPWVVLDVESVGLHGEGYAAGWVVVDAAGKELEA